MAVNFGPKFIVSEGLILQLIASDPSNYVLDEVEYLVVAGGGGGASADLNTSGTAAGGGAGGFLTGFLKVNPSTNYAVTIGNGGAGGAAGDSALGSNGQNSIFGPITAIGGGYGGSCPSPAGNSGGSGGGASGCGGGPGSGTPGQGFPGGVSNNNSYAPANGAAGGGGAGGPGENGSGPKHGSGGPGRLSSISGTPTYYAGGGGGGGSAEYFPGGAGGIGGGGQGGFRINQGGPTGSGVPQGAGTPGRANTGGGGGAGGSTDGSPRGGGAGGSGIVIIKYPGPQKATGGNTITQIGGFTIHTFTSSGTFTTLGFPSNGASVYGLQDFSGQSHRVIQSGGVVYNTSNNGSLYFDGVNDYVDVTSNLGILSQYTICHWSRREAENRMPIGWRSGPTFYQYGDNSWYYTHGGVGGEYYYPKSVSIPAGTWGFYCITYDGSAVRIYRNGVLEGSQSTTGTADWTNGLRIGFWGGGTGYQYLGNISTVLMYNRALTQQEITQNFNAQRGRFGI